MHTQRRITTPTAVIKLIHFGFHKYDLWLLVVSGERGGQSAADTWNDWESAACSHYLVPCIVIITPALSAPLLPSLLAIVIVIDWCGGQNSAVWKGIRHTSHNRPAIWSSPPPPSHWLLLHLSILRVFSGLKGSGSQTIRKHACRWVQIRHARSTLFSVFLFAMIEYNYSLCSTHAWIDNTCIK